MSIFVVHKIGFFYTDECFEPVEEGNGSVVSQHDSLSAATKAKQAADIDAMQDVAGTNAVDFFFYSNDYDAVASEMKAYYKSEYNVEIEDEYYFDLPSEISDQQALKLLEIMKLTFHNIVEYENEDTIIISHFDEMIGEFGSSD